MNIHEITVFGPVLLSETPAFAQFVHVQSVTTHKICVYIYYSHEYSVQLNMLNWLAGSPSPSGFLEGTIGTCSR